jgi:hypothetical protein
MNILRTERDTVNDNELKLSKALSDCHIKLDKDERLFEDYIEKENKSSLMMEYKLADFQSSNRDLYTQKKKLMYDHKHITDDLERTIKNIYCLKGYASFVLTVLDYPIRFNKKDFFNITDEAYDIPILKPKKEKAIDIQVEELLEEFAYLEKNYEEEIAENDYMIMIYKFEELQDNTLKTLTQTQDLQADIDWKRKEIRKELADLDDREDVETEEMDKLLSDMKGCSKLTKSLLRQTGEENLNDYLIGLAANLLTHTESLMPEYKRKKSIYDEKNPIKDLIELLKVSLYNFLESRNSGDRVYA